jgi:hypothetical protein
MYNFFRIPIARLLISALIPLIGYLFFEWKLFDVAMLYLLESVAVFFVFNFHQYFVREKTRYPIPFALIQLGFSLIFFSGLIVVYAFVAFALSGEGEEGLKHFTAFGSRMEAYNIPLVVSVLIIIELVSFYTKFRKNPNIEESNFFRVMKRLLYSHLLIIGGLIPLIFLAFSPAFMFMAFVAMKITFDVMMDNLRIIAIIRKRLGIKRKKKPNHSHDGYLLKKRTYRRRTD